MGTLVCPPLTDCHRMCRKRKNLRRQRKGCKIDCRPIGGRQGTRAWTRKHSPCRVAGGARAGRELSSSRHAVPRCAHTGYILQVRPSDIEMYRGGHDQPVRPALRALPCAAGRRAVTRRRLATLHYCNLQVINFRSLVTKNKTKKQVEIILS